MKRLLTTFVVLVVAGLVALPMWTGEASAATNYVRDETTGVEYTGCYPINDALKAIPEGETRTLTVYGSVGIWYGSIRGDTPAGVNVSIVPGSPDATITGNLQIGKSDVTITLGDDSENHLQMNGSISVYRGHLVTNKNLAVESTGDTLLVGVANNTGPATATINGGTFHSTGISNPLIVQNEDAVVTNISNATFIGDRQGSYDGAITVCYGGRIEKMENTTVVGNTLYAIDVSWGGSIGTIDGCTISNAGYSPTGKTGHGIGVRIGQTDKETRIGAIKDTAITMRNGESTAGGYLGSGIILQNGNMGPCYIDAIDGCTINTYSGSYGAIALNKQGKLTGDTKISKINNCQINCHNGASGIALSNVIVDEMVDNEVTTNIANASGFGYPLLVSGGSVDTLSGGKYINHNNDAVRTRSSAINTVDGDIVLYSKNSYALHNTEATANTKLEPSLTTQMQGNGRYFGGQGSGANLYIADAAKIDFPLHKGNNAPYYGSTFTEPVTGIDGVDFHYLTTDCKVVYDPNGATGQPVTKYEGEWHQDLKAEENLFTDSNRTFTGWNTKADGSGTAYEPGDILDITEATMTLYAQWEGKGAIQLSFGILNPGHRIEGTPLRDIQLPRTYAVSWWWQPDYLGGAATLKDSTGKVVGSFDGEATHTFDNLPPGEYDIVLDVLNEQPLVLNVGVHNGWPISDIIVWSEDSDLLHVTVTGNETDVIRRWVSLERKAFGFKTVTDVGVFEANPAGSAVPGAPAMNGKEYVYYAAYQGGNNWHLDNPEIDEKPYIPYVQAHIGIYFGETASLYRGMSTLQVPTLNAEEQALGYEFKGWKLQGDDSGKIYTEQEALAYPVRQHVVFEAVWDRTKVKVSFDSDGGSAVPAQIVDRSAKAVKPEDPTKKGHTFQGWYLGEEAYDFDTPVTDDITLKARWKKNEDPPTPTQYTITYDLNGGEYQGSTANITETYDEGTVIEIHAAPTRKGYTFLYWKGSEYRPGDEYTVTEDHTFTAQWKKTPAATADQANLIGATVLLLASASVLVIKRKKGQE